MTLKSLLSNRYLFIYIFIYFYDSKVIFDQDKIFNNMIM